MRIRRKVSVVHHSRYSMQRWFGEEEDTRLKLVHVYTSVTSCNSRRVEEVRSEDGLSLFCRYSTGTSISSKCASW